LWNVPGTSNSPAKLEPENQMSNQPRYPLGDSESLRSASGKQAGEIGPNSLAANLLSTGDMQIDADTLRAQAQIAAEAGYLQLADNLNRAAELTAVPNEQLLGMYEQLRPGRATLAELNTLADQLEKEFSAPRTADLVREAAHHYARQGLCKETE
jgi:propanediol dehydratase small subunit